MSSKKCQLQSPVQILKQNASQSIISCLSSRVNVALHFCLVWYFILSNRFNIALPGIFDRSNLLPSSGIYYYLNCYRFLWIYQCWFDKYVTLCMYLSWLPLVSNIKMRRPASAAYEGLLLIVFKAINPKFCLLLTRYPIEKLLLTAVDYSGRHCLFWAGGTMGTRLFMCFCDSAFMLKANVWFGIFVHCELIILMAIGIAWT